MNNGWSVFTNTTTNTNYTIDSLTWSDSTYSQPATTPSKKKSNDPLDWLHERVDSICAMGRLS